MLTRSSLTIRLHPADDVVIARQQLVGGTTLIDEKVTVSGLVPPGHKVATKALAAGSPVRPVCTGDGWITVLRGETSQ